MQRADQIISAKLQQAFSANPAERQASSLKKNLQDQTTSSNSGETASYDKRIDTLFIRFSSIYGHLWINNFNDERTIFFAKKEWSDGLKPFNNAIIKEALLQFREKHRFPPSIPEFIACCKEKEARKRPTALSFEPIKKPSPEVANHHLNMMKAALTR